jgi:deoxyribonuclease-4
MSIAGGLHRAFDAAEAVGCTCMQIFVKNQRQWAGRPLTADDVRRFREAAQRAAVRPVFAHTTYLITLAATDRATARRSERTLVDERIRCEALLRVMNDPRWAGVPKILETPKGRDARGADPDAVNLRRLRRMIRTGA